MLRTKKHESLKSLDTSKRGCCFFNEIDGIQNAEVRNTELRLKNNRIIPCTNGVRKSDKILVVGVSFRSNKVFRHNLIKRRGRFQARPLLVFEFQDKSLINEARNQTRLQSFGSYRSYKPH